MQQRIDRRSVLTGLAAGLVGVHQYQASAAQQAPAMELRALPPVEDGATVDAVDLTDTGSALVLITLPSGRRTVAQSADDAYQTMGDPELDLIAVRWGPESTAVGWIVGDQHGDTAALITSESLVELPGGSPDSRALAMAAGPQVVGTAAPASGAPRKPVAWSDIDVIDLVPELEGEGEATVVNAIGVIAGWFATADAPAGTALAWVQGERLSISEPGDGSRPAGINDAGQVVGWRSTPGEAEAVPRPWLWDQQGMVELALPAGAIGARARDINDIGLIVGAATTSADDGLETHAVMWTGEVVHDLHDLVGGDAPFRLTDAVAINNFGQVLCRAIDAEGRPAAALLSLRGN